MCGFGLGQVDWTTSLAVTTFITEMISTCIYISDADKVNVDINLLSFTPASLQSINCYLSLVMFISVS